MDTVKAVLLMSAWILVLAGCLMLVIATTAN